MPIQQLKLPPYESETPAEQTSPILSILPWPAKRARTKIAAVSSHDTVGIRHESKQQLIDRWRFLIKEDWPSLIEALVHLQQHTLTLDQSGVLETKRQTLLGLIKKAPGTDASRREGNEFFSQFAIAMLGISGCPVKKNDVAEKRGWRKNVLDEAGVPEKERYVWDLGLYLAPLSPEKRS
ncbi:hypothetical protein BU26DRAFT_516195 [Trematosphaeria pertusa]|uniref:Uncharacterized protein n=1 Tax=Trematosphaeria pertusa TaxID=390896 RepID=A0A6A6ITR6_9PLEO|nr:uncharacterized protein BU26DRAFT_516195 [Trematosphaeria pertusa]KAF2253931.1 hypothetical protein BU26DRAFT_516195 [Trematosphaeria pertusa]